MQSLTQNGLGHLGPILDQDWSNLGLPSYSPPGQPLIEDAGGLTSNPLAGNISPEALGEQFLKTKCNLQIQKLC